MSAAAIVITILARFRRAQSTQGPSAMEPANKSSS